MLVRVVDSLNGVNMQVRDWEFDAPKLTLRALMRERVRREVESFNLHRPVVYHGLVQPDESERILNGYQLKRLRSLDPEQEFQRAVHAFNTNGMIVLAYGRQIQSLDEEIDLDRTGEVEFLKLVPLIGG